MNIFRDEFDIRKSLQHCKRGFANRHFIRPFSVNSPAYFANKAMKCKRSFRLQPYVRFSPEADRPTGETVVAGLQQVQLRSLSAANADARVYPVTEGSTE